MPDIEQVKPTLAEIQQLLADRTTPELAHQNRRMALHLATILLDGQEAQQATEVITLLLRNDQEPELTTHDRKTALHVAAKALNGPGAEHAATVINELLSKGGIELNQHDKEGQLVLNIVAKALRGPAAKHAAQVITLLLEKGADPKLIDQDRKTALHISAAAFDKLEKQGNGMAKRRCTP